MKIAPFLFNLLITLSYFSAASTNDSIFPDIPKWDLDTTFPAYTPDNLWNYINGAAVVYLSYGFTDLEMAEYTRGKSTIRVEIYHHKNALNAFGIYSAERAPDFNFIGIGTQGYLEGTALNFLAGEYYVKMQANSEKEPVIESMKEIAGKLATGLAENFEFPKTLAQFPNEGKIMNSEKYIAANYLGHEFFSDVFTADYKKEEEEFTLFIAYKPGAGECKNLLMKYFEFTGQDPAEIREGKLVVKDRFNGDISLLWIGNMLMGVVGKKSETPMDGTE